MTLERLKLVFPALLAALLLGGCAMLRDYSELQQKRQEKCLYACPCECSK